MSKEELLKKLGELPQSGEAGDFEIGHCDADSLLLEFINDNEIAKAFKSVGRWYA